MTILCVGDHVIWAPTVKDTPRSYLYGVVTEVEDKGSVVRVKFQAGAPTRIVAAFLVLLRCRSCGMGFSAHVDGRKCLYGPGNWEEQEP